MFFTDFEKHILKDALELYFDEKNLDYLKCDSIGHYSADSNVIIDYDEKYDAKLANTIVSLLDRL
ncbi:hypothetical protein [Ligilactobacillus animalis]